MVRSDSVCSNSILPEFSTSANTEIDQSTDEQFTVADELFDELTRWHDVLRPHADALRGPRP